MRMHLKNSPAFTEPRYFKFKKDKNPFEFSNVLLKIYDIHSVQGFA